MPIKPIEQPIEKPKVVSGLVWVKIAFLIGGIALGTYIVSHYSQYQLKNPVVPRKERNIPNPFPTQIVKKGQQPNTKQAIMTYTQTKARELSGTVLGEATKVVAPIAKQTQQIAVDYVYKNTVEVVVKKLIEVLPESRKKAVDDWLKTQ